MIVCVAGGCPRNLPNFIKGLSAIFLREIARIELMLICYRWASEGTPSQQMSRHAVASRGFLFVYFVVLIFPSTLFALAKRVAVTSETSLLYGDAAH
jgi:hypothetical protein